MKYGLFLAAVLIGVSSARSQSSTSNIAYVWPDSLKGQSVNVWSVWNDSDTILVATAPLGLMRSTDNGQNWKRIPIALDDWSNYSFGTYSNPSTNTILSGTANGIFRSTDNGATWMQPAPPPPYTTWKYGAAVSCFLTLHDGSILAGVTKGIVKSTDGGATWQTVLYDTVNNLAFLSLAANKQNGYVFASFGPPVGIFRSTDNGLTWEGVNQGLGDLNVTTVAVSDSGIVYAGTSQHGIYRSMDNGDDWERMATPDTAHHYKVNAILCVKNLVFVGFDFVSFDAYSSVLRYDGSTWTDIMPSNVNGSSIGVLSFAIQDNSLLVGTSDGLWNISNVLTAVHEPTPTVPSRFTLSQNYPNPFNPTTSILYTVSSREYTTLTVYNVLGQKVATLVDEEKAPGSYTATFDGSKLPSGIYLYRLQAGNFTQTKKMVLVK
jgi:photosystem II stability/assembly factor-like uncharacterized protein